MYAVFEIIYQWNWMEFFETSGHRFNMLLIWMYLTNDFWVAKPFEIAGFFCWSFEYWKTSVSIWVSASICVCPLINIFVFRKKWLCWKCRENSYLYNAMIMIMMMMMMMLEAI